MDTVAGKTHFIRYGDILFKCGNVIFPIFMVVLLIAFKPDVTHEWLGRAGLAVTLTGQCLRFAIIGFANFKLSGLNKNIYANTLVVSGFFGACRNPLYVGNMLILEGLLLMHGNLGVIFLGSVFFVVTYQAIITAEEHFLRTKFGAEYEAYCANVPRWWIVVDRLPALLSGISFNWRKAIYKDYSTVGSWATQAIIVMAYREYTATSVFSALMIYELIALWVVVAIVRMVKKTYPL